MPARTASPAAPTTSLGRGPRPAAIAAAMGRTKSRVKLSMRSCSDAGGAGAISSGDTDERGLALGNAATDAGGAETAAAPAQLVEQRHEDARPAGPDGMADRDRAAVDVDQLGVHLEHARA